MYPLEHIYSINAYQEWRKWRPEKNNSNLKDFQQTWRDVRDGLNWEVSNWDELRTAISFLILMNKRHVLYFRGQKDHYDRCLPVLFRNQWYFKKSTFPLTEDNRVKYYSKLPEFRASVLKVAKQIGTKKLYPKARTCCDSIDPSAL